MRPGEGRQKAQIHEEYAEASEQEREGRQRRAKDREPRQFARTPTAFTAGNWVTVRRAKPFILWLIG